jgi:diadenosine tetraphosphate (Ap4A) HIT family hydrolase
VRLCRWCRHLHNEIDPMNVPDPRFLIYENAQFRAEQSNSCALPGYVIVTARYPAPSLSTLRPEALALLGPTLWLVTRAVEVTVKPERVYCARYGEATAQVHFHVFPRTREMAEAFLAAHPDDREISGPKLFDWAVERFARDAAQGPDGDLAVAIDALRALCVRD